MLAGMSDFPVFISMAIWGLFFFAVKSLVLPFPAGSSIVIW